MKTQAEFVLLPVAPYLDPAKTGLMASAISGIEHPHYTESYYYLATRIT